MKKKISPKEFDALLDLANLDSIDSKREVLMCSIDSILDWIDCLEKLETENVKELVHLFNKSCEAVPDQIKNPLRHEDALSNACSKNSNYIVVPVVK
jgi:aspartyl-tRNA(Asn)/glutamyl-tRNA(Gln) amidotransferase subunit C